MHGAVKRIRPKIMTVSVILAGLIPIMFSHGTGADIMKRIAAPMIGGLSPQQSSSSSSTRNLHDLAGPGIQ